MKFWAYLHKNNSVQVKTVMWTYADDIHDAKNSPFAIKIMNQFEAKNREDAFKQATEYFKKEDK